MKVKKLIEFLKENYHDDEDIFWQTYRKKDIGENINSLDWNFAIEQVSNFEMGSVAELLDMYIEESKLKREKIEIHEKLQDYYSQGERVVITENLDEIKANLSSSAMACMGQQKIPNTGYYQLKIGSVESKGKTPFVLVCSMANFIKINAKL